MRLSRYIVWLALCLVGAMGFAAEPPAGGGGKSFPERMLDDLYDFSQLYTDTAFTVADCKVVVKVVLMSRKRKSRRVSICVNDSIGDVHAGQMIRFVPGCLDEASGPSDVPN